MKGSQVGSTECGNNWIGYVIHQAPGPMMAVQPTVEMAKRNSKQRISPLIEDSDVLRGLVKDARSKDSGNTVLAKEFPGGILVMTGANSAVGLRSMAARYLFLDEVDAYPGDVDGEGDPVNLALARARTFARRKIFLTSTPKISGLSRVEKAFLESDQRRYWVPCPFCDEFQTLRFAQLKWPTGEPRDAVYLCEHCEQPIENYQKSFMLERGEWRASAAGDGKTAGFHLSGLYSPVGWYPWSEAAADFEKAQKHHALQPFINTVLGETWSQEAEAPEWRRLYERREDYRSSVVPARGLFLTAAVDVQKDRLEYLVKAWGRDHESWGVDKGAIAGDPADAAVWHRIDMLLESPYTHELGGSLPISVLAVDSQYETQRVYEWVRRHDPARVIAVHGGFTGSLPLGTPAAVDVSASGQRIRRGLKVWPVGSSYLKGTIYGRLRLDAPTEEETAAGAGYPPGFHHYPMWDQEFFEQLTAEVRVRKRNRKGYAEYHWEKKRERNEALDLEVYNTAAFSFAGGDRLLEKHWVYLESVVSKSHLRSEQQQAQRRRQRDPGAEFWGDDGKDYWND